MTLVCEHYENGIEEAEECQWGEEGDKPCHQEFFGREIPDCVSGYDARHKRYA